jgi:hypothetical protein
MTNRRDAEAQRLRGELEETNVVGGEDFAFNLTAQRTVRFRSEFGFPLRLLRAFAPLR